MEKPSHNRRQLARNYAHFESYKDSTSRVSNSLPTRATSFSSSKIPGARNRNDSRMTWRARTVKCSCIAVMLVSLALLLIGLAQLGASQDVELPRLTLKIRPFSPLKADSNVKGTRDADIHVPSEEEEDTPAIPSYFSSNTVSTTAQPTSVYIAKHHLNKPPLVTREMLQALGVVQYDIFDTSASSPYHLDADDSAQAPLLRLPIVTSIPEARIAPPTFDNLCNIPPSGCRFLLPITIAEQESKARIHFAQILHLAQKLNRTLVLPDVGKSRLSGCLKKEFEWYYDLPNLRRQLSQEQENGMPRAGVVEMKRFKSWLGSRFTDPQAGRIINLKTKVPPPQAGTSSLSRTTHSNDLVRMTVNSQTKSIYEHKKQVWCTQSKFKRIDFSAFGSVYIAPSSKGKEKELEYGDAVVDAILTWLQDGDGAADVLALNWDLRHRIFHSIPVPPSDVQTPGQNLDEDPVDGGLAASKEYAPSPEKVLGAQLVTLNYSKALHDLAKKLAPSKPYLAIHWRMETISPSLLPDCARNLISSLETLLHRNVSHDEEERSSRIDTIWFASDYPYALPGSRSFLPSENALWRSTTFRKFSPEHEDAVHILHSAFNASSSYDEPHLTSLPSILQGKTLTGLSERLAVIKSDKGSNINVDLSANDMDLLDDSGALGILDKIVAMNAAGFIAGNRACARHSSYTKQIIDARQARHKSENIGRVDEVWSSDDVEWFGPLDS